MGMRKFRCILLALSHRKLHALRPRYGTDRRSHPDKRGISNGKRHCLILGAEIFKMPEV